MKKLFKPIYLSVFIIGIIVFSCSKEVVQTNTVAPYSPSDLDVNAGKWKTYILSAPTDITVAAPLSLSDARYLNQVDSVKKAINNLTPADRATIDYWGAGTVYRWNEIARELAARYNLAPPANADGTYPVPDANNPLVVPKFPFANPPYTARALAYLSVAQYDAMVSAYYYKFLYNRKPIYKYDNSVPPQLPASDLPSYPSEAGVIAGASYTVLAAMFPGEIPYLQSKLAECKNARILAAMNISSENDAGESLGRSVAAKVMARAKTDEMGAANNQTLVPGLKDAASARGMKELWVSQETPLRPPMLPNYGSVATWNFSKTDLANIRPAIPYIVGSAEFNKDLEELRNIKENQTREQARIANFWSDGAGSYTPPGHWHRFACEAALEKKYSEVRMARTLALVGTSLMDAGIACWEAKYYYFAPRPQQFGISTSVGLPNFPSYASGHSTFSAAAADVLSYIFPEKASTFNDYAKEASNSRIYGLIHYRVDCEMGLVHGKKIGDFAIARGKADGSGL